MPQEQISIICRTLTDMIASMAICPLRPVAHATTSQTEHGHQAYLSDHPEARVSDGRPAITLQPHLDLRSLPPKPGERDIERAPSSAAEVVDANSNLSVEHLKCEQFSVEPESKLY